MRAAIEQGSLAPGSRLPPTRSHAQLLGVGRNTVLWALQRLQAEGFVQSRVGSGTVVTEGLRQVRLPPPGLAPVTAALSRRGTLLADVARHWRPPVADARALRIGAPEVASFPFALWDRLARQCQAAQRQAQAQYLDPAGLPALLDLRGRPDMFGRILEVSISGFADEIAAAASLVQGQGAEGQPVVLVRGLGWDQPATGAAELVRPAAEDMFR